MCLGLKKPMIIKIAIIFSNKYLIVISLLFILFSILSIIIYSYSHIFKNLNLLIADIKSKWPARVYQFSPISTKVVMA